MVCLDVDIDVVVKDVEAFVEFILTRDTGAGDDDDVLLGAAEEEDEELQVSLLLFSGLCD